MRASHAYSHASMHAACMAHRYNQEAQNSTSYLRQEIRARQMGKAKRKKAKAKKPARQAQKEIKGVAKTGAKAKGVPATGAAAKAHPFGVSAFRGVRKVAGSTRKKPWQVALKH